MQCNRSRTEVWGRNSTSAEHISQSERLRAAQDAGGFSRSSQWLSGGHGPVQYSVKVTSPMLYGKILNMGVEQKWLFYSSVASIRMTRSLWRACRRWRRRRVPRMPRWSWTVMIWRAAARREIWRAVTVRRRSGPIRSSGSACSDPQHSLRDSWASALQKNIHALSCVCVCALRRDAVMLTAAFCWWVIDTDVNRICGWHLDLLAFWCVWSLVLSFQFCHIKDYLSHYENTALHWFDLSSDMNSLTPAWPQDQIHKWFTLNGFSNIS